MFSKKLLIVTFFITISISLFADTGKVRGKLIDDGTGEPIPFANVSLLQNGTPKGGVASDFDGNYTIEAEPGTYDLLVSYVSYANKKVTGISVKPNDITLVDIRMEGTDMQLDEVVVSVNQARNTENALLTIQKKSVNILDGVSAQSFKKVGDGSAAQAIKRVPGVSIQGGKYVFVRGLGDRYTKTQLNGLDVPGLDPDRNALQMDIFPTNIIDNIIVLKSFTAELPADFTGGIVNIETKEFPEEPTLDVSVGIGYTPGMNLNSNYLTQNKSNTDFLGMDNGYRDEPLNMSESNPNPTGKVPAPLESQNSTAKTQAFNDELAAQQGQSPLNYSLSVAGGNQVNKGEKTLGYTGAVSYKNNTDFYQNREQNFYRKQASDPAVYELRDEVLQQGDLGVNNVFLSGLFGGAMKGKYSKHSITLMHLQNGERRSGIYNEQNLISSNNESKRDNLEYTERSISNVLVSGKYRNVDDNWKYEWKISPTISKIQDKDIRSTAYLINQDDSSFSIDPSEVAFPSRIWRNLNEINLAGKFDVSNKHQLNGHNAVAKFGIAYTYKARNYEILNYELQTKGNLDYTGNPDELLSDDFIWTDEKGEGTFIFGNYQRSNTYEGTQTTLAAYASEEFKITKKLKGVAGLRLEKYDQYYTGQNQIANTNPNNENARIFNNDKILDLLNLFPTISFIYETDENSNLRLGYFRTTARPSFKEKSTAEIVDPLSGLTFIGNIDLVQTNINNYDVRYEYYFRKSQTIALSGFYKTFENPIELTSFQQAPNSFQPRNVGDARVMGIEFESKVNLDILSNRLTNFNFKSNISFINSRVRFDTSANGTLQGKKNGLRAGEELGEFRDMQGQAPYIVNVGLAYSNKEKELEVGLYYNVQGPKLVIVGINLSPDIYSVPFHSLNFNFLKKFGADNSYQLSFGVSNILNDLAEEVTRSYNATDKIFSRYNPGRTFSIGLSKAFK